MRRGPVGAVAACVTCLVLAACGNGGSILDAGNDITSPTTTATLPPVTAAPGQTLPPTTPPPIATTTTAPLSALPPCPVDALDDVTAPVDITFWHALGSSLEDSLAKLTDEYNASQTKVRVTLQNQGGYKEAIDKYTQSGQADRPQLVMMPEYMVQQMADSKSVIPVGACMQAEGFDESPFLPRVLLGFQTTGVQWSMPFNISDPVLFYNMASFEQAGLDPTHAPLSLEELRTMSEQLVASGAVGTGIALDSGVDSGGGWFLEQWFARANELYADNGNGRLAPATKVLFAGPTGVTLLTAVQSLVQDGLAVTVGDNPNGQDALLKLADPAQPAAMAIATSAAIGTVINVLDGGLIPGITSAQLGVAPMPGPGDVGSATVGGASLYIVSDKGDPAAAAAWDFIKFLTSAQSQSSWAAATGYVPIRQDALDLEPLASKYVTDPRFKVPYDQLLAGRDDLSAVGPVIGPLRQVRAATAGAVASVFGGADVQASLTAAAEQADALITQYNALN
jgi:sn-glycerol 3-phosphate transport system substrate-binding protein